MPHNKSPQCAHALLLPLPECRLNRSALLIARRTAMGGHQDAQAALFAMHSFGVRFRKPLTLIRCLVHELAQTSHRTIRIAPCCAAGMTRDEGLLLEAIGGGGITPLLALTDNEDCGNLLPIAGMLRNEFSFLRLARRQQR